MKNTRILLIYTLLATLLASCATTNQTSTEIAAPKAEQNQQTTPAEEVPYSVRLKQARKPYGFVLFQSMDVADGMEKQYLRVEKEWLKIHEHLAKQGKILSWGLAKARENSLGYEYVTWKTFRSLKDLEATYDWDELGKWMGQEKLDLLFEKTNEARTITGSQVLRQRDYAQMPLSQTSIFENLSPQDISFRLNFLAPTPGNRAKYLEIVEKAYSPLFEKRAEIDKTFLGWEYQELMYYNGQGNTEPFRGIDIFRNDIPELTEAEQEIVNAELPSWPEDIYPMSKRGELRTMTTVTFDIVHVIMQNAESTLMNELVGTWTHTNPDGSYRTKTVTPYAEQLSFFASDGTLLQKRQPIPLRIEASNKLTRFTGFFPNGKTWNASIQIHDGKWYEQDRAFTDLEQFDGVYPAAPDAYFVYEKSAEPAQRNLAAYDNSEEGTALIRNIVESYAKGDFKKLRSYFSDDAKVVHNQWGPAAEGITIDELIETHKKHHATLAKPVEVLNSIYEAVTLPNGGKHAHGWINMRNTTKSGEVTDTNVFVAFGVGNDGKATYEWALFDPAGIPSYQK